VTTAEERLAISNDPTTPSPFAPQPGICGHCGNADKVETQGHCYFCFSCGKITALDGKPIHGNGHFMANHGTLPVTNCF
jgi:hypothetical protein